MLIPLLAPLLASCGTTAVYQPVNYEEIHGRRAVFLQPVYLPPIKKSLHTRIVNEAEAGLSKFPHLGGLMTREEAKAKQVGNSRLARDYELSAETLSVVGISERGTSARLGKALDVELLVMVQIFFTPCQKCLDDSQLAFVANVVEAESARLLWRGHFLENMAEPSQEEIEQEAEEMLEEFFEILEEDLRPKWHRQRFSNLHRAARA